MSSSGLTLTNATLQVSDNPNGYWTTIGSVGKDYTFEILKPKNKFEIKEVIFNRPYTIVKWANGDKTIVKQGMEDVWDEEKALCWAVAKRVLETSTNIRRIVKNASRPYLNPKKNKKLLTDNPQDDFPF